MVAKIAKIQLEMKNGVKVRTISELKDNFDAEKLIGYYLDGKLKKWLETRWYEEELNALEALREDDCLLTKHLCEIFGIEYVDKEIDSEEVAEKSIRISKMKQYTDDDEIIKNIDFVAFNQEELADLYAKNIEKIYLCEGEFKIPKSKCNLKYELIGNINVEGLKVHVKEEQEVVDDINMVNRIPKEVADLIVHQSFVELQDYIVWTEYFVKSSKCNYRYYYEYFKNVKMIDLSKKFKVWDKRSNQFYSFNIPDVKLSYRMDYFFSFGNKIVFNDVSDNICVFDIKEEKLERFSEKLYLNKFVYGEWTEGPRHIEKTADSFKVLHFDKNYIETLNIPIKECGASCLCADNKLFYLFFAKETSFVYSYDFETRENRKIYEFQERISRFSNRMNYYNGELFVKYELDYNYYKRNYVEAKVIGLRNDGTKKEYIYKPKCSLVGHCDMRTVHRSKYWVFTEESGVNNRLYLLDMQYGILQEYENYQEIRLVDNYLYMYNSALNKSFRNDLCEGWNPVEIDNNILF